jgi:hypothetical protein
MATKLKLVRNTRHDLGTGNDIRRGNGTMTLSSSGVPNDKRRIKPKGISR